MRWVVGLRLLPVDIELQIAELLRINDVSPTCSFHPTMLTSDSVVCQIIPEKVENSHEKCAYERVEAERANNGLEAELKAVGLTAGPNERSKTLS